ncbi:MAG: rRNA pseudouridine synthase [Ktedonobacterales bacterium]|nr:rRNA pseudouridine synthase [Ktedonobacterales bacterium]
MTAEPPDVAPASERLQKYLAHAGIASRRAAEDLITAGAVTVNGIIATLGTRVDPVHDVVLVRGQRVQPVADTTTVALNKPVGYISSSADPEGRPIIADLLPQRLQDLRLVPVGRLDADSEGLILLSNDGTLTLQLTHPRYEKEKEYHALLSDPVSDEALAELRRGVVLMTENQRPTAPARVWRVRAPAEPGQHWVAVVLHEGRKRQVRHMFSAVGARVERLIRVRIGRLRLADVAPRSGSYRVLTPREIALARDEEAP